MKLQPKNFILFVIVLIGAYCLTTIMTPKILFWHGQTLYNNKNYIGAITYIKKALIFQPDNHEYRYYFVKSLSEIKPTYKVQKLMYEIANSEKDDSANFLAKEKITEWRRNIHANIGNNYIEQAPADSNVIRWNKSSFPLKIYIDNSTLENLPDYYKSAISRALSQWDKSVDFVSFTSTEKKSDAQILLYLKKMPDNVCAEGICKFVTGYTSPKISGHRLKNMTITIYDKNPIGEYFSDKEIYNTVLHELGHALGIMGHSYSTSDLMYMQAQGKDSIFTPYREDFHYLSGNDVNTLTLLYMLEPNITDTPPNDDEKLIFTPIILGSKKEIAEKKLEEAQDYIKSSPNLAAGYINLAGAYADLKEYKKALVSLESALDNAGTAEETYLIYYNFAYIYINMEKYAAALDYARLAHKIHPTQEVIELLNIIEYNRQIKSEN